MGIAPRSSSRSIAGSYKSFRLDGTEAMLSESKREVGANGGSKEREGATEG